jgi:endoglucanase
VNIGGGENGAKYDSKSALYFKQVGFNTFGLFTSWSRLIPNIATGSMKLSEASALTDAVNYITKSVGGFCVLELHDYGRYKGDALGKGEATVKRFADVWTKLANMYSNNSRVIFSLMNEPHDQDSGDYVIALQAAVTAIRGTGATNWIMIQGNRWNSAMNWLNVDEWGKSNTEIMPTVKDPNGKILFNIHQYLDATHGGSFDGCISNNIGALYLSGVTHWLRNNNAHAFLGEFGSSNDSTCKGAVDDVLKFLAANSDVWVGWSWWNAGAYLSDTSYSVQPMENEDGTYVANDKQKWLTSHFTVKCPVSYSSAQTDAKNWACVNLLNNAEGAISNDANETAPTDETGTSGTSKPGKVVSLKPKSAVHSGMSQIVWSSLVAALLAVLAVVM